MDDTPRPTFAGRLRVEDFRYRGEEKKRKAEAEKVEAKAEKSKSDLSPRKRSRKSSYAPPSTYAHLNLLPDALAPGLLVLFVGLNPGVQTARCGHAYAHPSNLFWKLLYRSGVTPVACRAEEDASMPARFRLGLTNIVARPSRNGAELRPAELDAGVAVLEAKTRRWRPEAVCIVGKGIWESIVRVRYQKPRQKPAFHYGWQDETENMGLLSGDDEEDSLADGVIDEPGWKGARVFVASSTSGLAATLSPAEKEAIWQQLGSWVRKRREEIEASTGEKWK